MQFTKDNLDGIDCCVVQQLVQTGTRENELEIIQYADEVVDILMKTWKQSMQRKENSRRESTSWHEPEGVVGSRGYIPTEDARFKVVPKWSEGFGHNNASASNRGSKSPVNQRSQELHKKAPLCDNRPTSIKALLSCRAEVPETCRHRCLPMSTHDRTSTHMQKEAELFILEVLLQDSSWSRGVKDRE